MGLRRWVDEFCDQIPPEVTDPESELYNRGSCWIMGGKLSIARAFAEQSKADFRKFLHSRAAELAPGGILQCYLSGRVDPTNQTIPERRHRFLAGPDFESAWEDLIAEVASYQSYYILTFSCLVMEFLKLHFLVCRD